MFQSYIAAAMRHLSKHALYAGINIFGLAVGLASVILILLFVRAELSYDSFWPEKERTYRLNVTFTIPGQAPMAGASSMGPLVPSLRAAIPEIEEATRINVRQRLVGDGEKREIAEVITTDSGFFDIFPLRFLAGDPKTALEKPDTVVLSRDMAIKYFGTVDVLGKSLAFENKVGLLVTGVVENWPANSHFEGGIFVPMITESAGVPVEEREKTWTNLNFYSYVRLKSGFAPENLVARSADVIDTHVDPMKMAGFPVKGHEVITITPVRVDKIHLMGGPGLTELKPQSDMRLVYIFSGIAVLILVLASINFTNLSTARATLRAREVAVRKVLGASRDQLIVQFLTESIVMALVALVVAMAAVEAVLPAFASFVDRQIHFDYWSNPALGASLFALAWIVGILGGTYPAFVLSAFRPVYVLKGNSSPQGGSQRMRSALVLLQFAVSIALAIATVVVSLQANHLTNKDLGLDQSQLVVVESVGRQGIREQRGAIMEALRKESGIVGVTAISEAPGDSDDNNLVLRETTPDGVRSAIQRYYNIAPGTLGTLGIRLLAGRDFDPSVATDRLRRRRTDGEDSTEAAVILNEMMLKRFNLGTAEEAIGKTLTMATSPSQPTSISLRIVGVIQNVHLQPLNKELRPTIYLWDESYLAYLIVKIAPGALGEGLSSIDRVWNRMVPSTPIKRSFVDDKLNKLYEQDRKRGQLLAGFAGLAVLIACLGLYGLAAFTAERRTREIGLRKVLGATAGDIVKLLLAQAARPVVAANLIAWPIVFYALSRWLESFPYRIDLSPVHFVAVGLGALAIAWATVASHALRASHTRPAEALRYE